MPPKPTPWREGETVDKEHSRLAEQFAEMASSTPARIGVGRTGTRPLTAEQLKLRLDHAAAVDAVYGEVPQSLLDAFGLFTVDTRFGDKEAYLRQPNLGRVLTAEAEVELGRRCKRRPQVQIVVSDGLSAKAVEDNLPDILPALSDSLEVYGLEPGTSFFVRGGRVGCMDDIGRILQPEVLVLLIGERPGLVTASSLSAYMCYRPGPGRKDSDRMVISNIHRRGTTPVEAGAHIGYLLRKMTEQRTSGVTLVL